nr:ATP-dependent DNA helicase PIF1-like [Tanacetum cinerariifolium]
MTRVSNKKVPVLVTRSPQQLEAAALERIKNSRIQIYIKKEWMFRDKLPLLPHKYKISFYKGTVVTRIDPFDENLNGFILEPFNRLLDGTLHYIHDTRHYHEHEAACNGKVSGANDGESTIVFPDNMLIPDIDDDVGAFIDDTYPNLLQNLWNPSFFQEKAILAPTHEMVDIINERMLSLLLGDKNEYESSDSVCLADGDLNFDDSIYTTEFLNGLRMSGIPNHSIKLKIGTHIMLMCNINQKAGICNGTRLPSTKIGNQHN